MEMKGCLPSCHARHLPLESPRKVTGERQQNNYLLKRELYPLCRIMPWGFGRIFPFIAFVRLFLPRCLHFQKIFKLAKRTRSDWLAFRILCFGFAFIVLAFERRVCAAGIVTLRVPSPGTPASTALAPRSRTRCWGGRQAGRWWRRGMFWVWSTCAKVRQLLVSFFGRGVTCVNFKAH